MQSCRVAPPLEAVSPNKGPLCVPPILVAAGAPSPAGRWVLARGAEWLVRGMRGGRSGDRCDLPAPVAKPLYEAVARPRLVLTDVVAAADEVLAVGVDGIL